ncbi:MAG: nucleotidyltransferase domain-containing protein [Algoriphagus sp.]
MKFGLSNSTKDILIDIFKKYPQIAHVLVYGSRAKGNYTSRSDLDLVIDGHEIDRFTLGELISELNESDFPQTIDLQSLDRIQNEKLIDHIRRVGKTFYKK